MRKISLSIGRLPGLNTEYTRRHWSNAHRERKQWGTAIAAALGPKNRGVKFERARVTATRYSRSSLGPDYDNLVFSFKPIFDALVESEVLIDDGPDCCERVYLWKPVTDLAQQRVDLLIEELP